jgi:hypothetical protein
MIHVVLHVLLAREHRNAQVPGAVLKLVQCGRCRTEYVYQMHRVGYGSHSSMLFAPDPMSGVRAWNNAAAALHRSLLQEVDPVPCPQCGHYQDDMVAAIRWRLDGWIRDRLQPGLLIFAIMAFAAAAVLASQPLINGLPRWFYLLGAMVFLIGTLLFFTHARAERWFASRYDPNDSTHKPRHTPSGPGVRREEFERRWNCGYGQYPAAPPPLPNPRIETESRPITTPFQSDMAGQEPSRIGL